MVSLNGVISNLWGQGVGAAGNLLASQLNKWAKTWSPLADRKVRLGALISGESLALTLLPKSFGPVQNLPGLLNAGMGVTNAQLLARELDLDIFQAANLVVDGEVQSAIQERDFRRALSHEVRTALAAMGVDTKGASEAEVLRMLNRANKFPGGLPALLATVKK